MNIPLTQFVGLRDTRSKQSKCDVLFTCFLVKSIVLQAEHSRSGITAGMAQYVRLKGKMNAVSKTILCDNVHFRHKILFSH